MTLDPKLREALGALLAQAVVFLVEAMPVHVDVLIMVLPKGQLELAGNVDVATAGTVSVKSLPRLFKAIMDRDPDYESLLVAGEPRATKGGTS